MFITRTLFAAAVLLTAALALPGRGLESLSNAQRFSRGLPPKKPGRFYDAASQTRPAPARRSAMATGSYLAVYDSTGNTILGYVCTQSTTDLTAKLYVCPSLSDAVTYTRAASVSGPNGYSIMATQNGNTVYWLATELGGTQLTTSSSHLEFSYTITSDNGDSPGSWTSHKYATSVFGTGSQIGINFPQSSSGSGVAPSFFYDSSVNDGQLFAAMSQAALVADLGSTAIDLNVVLVKTT